MSSPILPIEGPSGSAPAAPQPPLDPVAFANELTASDRALSIRAGRGGPPPGLVEEILAAGRVEDALHAGGHQLRFSAGTTGARVEIELTDLSGRALRSLSPSEALRIASGGPVG